MRNKPVPSLDVLVMDIHSPVDVMRTPHCTTNNSQEIQKEKGTKKFGKILADSQSNNSTWGSE